MSTCCYDQADFLRVIPHTVREFGIEARKNGKVWELAFNGPIQPIGDKYGVCVRLARIKNPTTRELFSTNILFHMPSQMMHGMHNVYDLVHQVQFTRIVAPAYDDNIADYKLSLGNYEPNPEGVILEDIRIAPMGDLWWVTGQGYRGKVLIGDGFVHDVSVYGALVDPLSLGRRLELLPLFGGNKQGSYKNSVLLPSPEGETWIGARSMYQTKNLHFFSLTELGWQMRGEICGLSDCMPKEAWEDVRRVGLGSNFVPCPELGGFVGFVHVVSDKNSPAKSRTNDLLYPNIEEQYDGWAVLLKIEKGQPVIKGAARALTPDSKPFCYSGLGELFSTKRVAFPISLYVSGTSFHVGYGWGDRSLFEAVYERHEMISQLMSRSAERSSVTEGLAL